MQKTSRVGSCILSVGRGLPDMNLQPIHPSSVSVIIAAHREGPMVDACFQAVANLRPAPGEVIIAVDGGCPKLVAAAEAHGFSVIPLPRAPGVSAARNAGARLASGSVLAFLDSDVVAQEDHVARILSVLTDNPGARAAFGSYDNAPAADGLVSRYRNLLHHFTHQNSRREAETFWAACGVCEATAFLAVGGFDENYRRPSIEDIELGYRLRRAGYRIVLEPSWQIRHLKRWRLRDLILTDFSCRAVPWTLLLLQKARMDNDLNIDSKSRISAILILVSLISGSLGLASFQTVWMSISALAAAVTIAINLRFYLFLHRQGGLTLALASIPLHFLYFLTAISGYIVGRCIFQIRHFRGENSRFTAG